MPRSPSLVPHVYTYRRFARGNDIFLSLSSYASFLELGCIYILFKMYVRDTSVSRAMIRFDTLLSCWQQRAIVVNGYTVVTLSLLSRRLSLSHLSQKRTMFATILSNVSLWCLFAASDCLLVGPERALADGHTTVRHSHCQTQTTNDHE